MDAYPYLQPASPPPTLEDPLAAIRRAVAAIMTVDDTTLGQPDQFFMRFRGHLTVDSQAAYAQLSEALRPLGFTPLFRLEKGQHVVLVMKGVINPPPSRAWINYLMFGLTMVSVLVTGAFYAATSLPTSLAAWGAFVWRGVPFLVSMVGILLAHEFGHYFAARYHKIAVTLPYFIPLPLVSPLGTMGAFIQLKAPPTNRRVLLDIGIAGPLAGFCVALPILIYGLLTSPVTQISPAAENLAMEGNSILYAALKFLIYGQWLPMPDSYEGLAPWLYMLRYYALGFPSPAGGLDVQLNDIAWAGWAGLLVTGLNLIPAGQLDGGHALYVLIGRRARYFVPVILVVLVGLGFFYTGWFLWAALIYFLGRTHAEPLDQITALDPARQALAVFALVLFVLVIIPIPLKTF